MLGVGNLVKRVSGKSKKCDTILHSSAGGSECNQVSENEEVFQHLKMHLNWLISSKHKHSQNRNGAMVFLNTLCPIEVMTLFISKITTTCQ